MADVWFMCKADAVSGLPVVCLYTVGVWELLKKYPAEAIFSATQLCLVQASHGTELRLLRDEIQDKSGHRSHKYVYVSFYYNIYTLNYVTSCV